MSLYVSLKRGPFKLSDIWVTAQEASELSDEEIRERFAEYLPLFLEELGSPVGMIDAIWWEA